MKRMIIATAVIAAVVTACSMKEDVVGPKVDTGTKDSIVVTPDTNIVDTDGDGDLDTTITLDTTVIKIDTSGNETGVVIASKRTEQITFDTDGKPVTSIIGLDTIAANDLRAEIDKENMSLSLFAVTGLKLNGTSEFAEFALANASQKVVISVSTMLPGVSPELAISSPYQAGKELTLGEIQKGVTLNNGLYVKNSSSLPSFESKLKDLTVSDIVFVVEMKFVDGTVTVPNDFTMEFTIEGTSKKKL